MGDQGSRPQHAALYRASVWWPTSMLAQAGLSGSVRADFALPLVRSSGAMGEAGVLPVQVGFSEIKLAPRHSGQPNGASRL